MQALGKYILLVPVDEEEEQTTAVAFIKGESETKEAKVLSIGKDVNEELDIKLDDVVLFLDQAKTKFTQSGKEYFLVDQDMLMLKK